SETDIAEAFTPNTDLAWQKVSKRVNLQATQPAAMPAAKVEPMYQWALRVAAVLVLALGVVWFVYRSSEQGMLGGPQLTEQSTTSGQTKVLLADGTQVWLNRNSKLRYPDTFEGNTREVYLEGEAFFDVQRNPEKPFLIHAQQSVTQVLGTSFNVEAYENQPEVKVTVVTGKVSLAEEGKQSEVVLTPGEQGIFKKDSGKVIKKQNEDLNFLAWQTGILTFRKNTLEQVTQALQKHYNQPVELENEAIKHCRFTATLDNQPLTEVLEVLKLTLDLEYQTTSGKTVLSGKGCTPDS
ncbi:MAG: FecR domain-containing protein, partial [Hymenobacteraceae bacterium]|nr:FecR domain-containing protein [Hymenobacteraceae bacterium]MDX5396018.1 FecR domain-containing protein [Hymenobacteraceae bacterium]MDX5512079.1 FecR domain-containing protein [Hymenobacteraceae bacterium]